MQFFPGRALYLRTDQLFAPGDRYYTWKRTPSGSWIRARKLDNTHVCPYGAAELGALVDGDLTPGARAPDHGAGLGGRRAGCTTPTTTTPPAPAPTTNLPAGYAGVAVPGPPS